MRYFRFFLFICIFIIMITDIKGVEPQSPATNLNPYTGWGILAYSKVPQGCECQISMPCPWGGGASCSVSGLWGCVCEPTTCEITLPSGGSMSVPGVRCYAFPGNSSVSCCPPPPESLSGKSLDINTPNVESYPASYVGKYEHLLYRDTIFVVKPFLTSYQLAWCNSKVFYHRINGHTLYTSTGDSLHLNSVDGIMKIAPLSRDELMIVSPTKFYRYTISTHDVKKLGEYNDVLLLPQCVEIKLPYIVISTFNGVKVFLYEGDNVQLITQFQPGLPSHNIKYSWQKHILYRPIIGEESIVLVHLSSPYVTVYSLKGEHKRSMYFSYPDYIDQLTYVDTTLKIRSTCEACHKIKCFLFDASLVENNKLLCSFCGAWFIIDLEAMEVRELAFYDRQHNGTFISQIVPNADGEIWLVNILPLIAENPQIELLAFKK